MYSDFFILSWNIYFYNWTYACRVGFLVQLDIFLYDWTYFWTVGCITLYTNVWFYNWTFLCTVGCFFVQLDILFSISTVCCTAEQFSIPFYTSMHNLKFCIILKCSVLHQNISSYGWILLCIVRDFFVQLGISFSISIVCSTADHFCTPLYGIDLFVHLDILYNIGMFDFRAEYFFVRLNIALYS